MQWTVTVKNILIIGLLAGSLSIAERLPAAAHSVNESHQGNSNTVEGVLTFRGNKLRNYHGKGQVPNQPKVYWRFPDKPMCSMSAVYGVAKKWCGMGWTGQPAVFERDGKTWVVFGAYDGAVHFIDGKSGQRLLPDFQTGDIIKGSVTVDPDGYPIIYTGSRDNYFRAIAIDREKPVELWSIYYNDILPTKWGTDWDSSALVLNDYLFVAGENSRFYIYRLNRSYDEHNHVTVTPKLIWNTAGWDAELIKAIGDNNVSIENSPLIIGNTVYFGNSGGLIQGWDFAGIEKGITPKQVFRYWVGDDVDATLVTDEDGMLYVGVEFDRATQRSKELGQIIKLDPSNQKNPVVWAVKSRSHLGSGVYGTPAVYHNMLIVPTHDGKVLGLNKDSGKTIWTLQLKGKVWPSPSVVDDIMVIGDCSGKVSAYDISESPTKLWQVQTGGCIEASAVIWKGMVYVGSRDGYFYALKDGSGKATALDKE